MGELSPSDAIALAGNGNNDGFGGNGNGWWIILLFMIFGWGGNRGYGNNGGNNGYVGGDLLYPWLNQSNQINDGFRDQMMNGTLNGIQQSVTAGFANAATQLCQCCADMQMALCNGFNNVNTNIMQGLNSIEAGANARQMANMQQQFAMQTATQQGFNALQAQQADCCCENRLATANQTSTLLADNAAKAQLILDKLCQLELDGVKAQLSQAERENVGLQNQLNMANLAASQQAQNQLISQGFANEVDALYNRLNSCPVPSMPVYGRTPIFTCNSQNNQGCGCGGFVG
jgi:hypothetical protein